MDESSKEDLRNNAVPMPGLPQGSERREDPASGKQAWKPRSSGAHLFQSGIMKRSTRMLALIVLVASMALFFVISGVVSTNPFPARAAGTRTFTFVNNTSQTIWAGALGNSGQVAPGNGGWAMAPGATTSVTVPDTWGGRFWGRTFCNFNSAGAGTCETGDCGGVLQCKGAGGIPPASLAEFTLGGSSGNDFYDVSFVDGFNVAMTITPVGGAQPTPGNVFWCGVAGCGTDLNPNCPSALRKMDSSGRIIACNSACGQFNTDQYCCRGAFGTAATCNPSNWPVNYASYFKSNCPYAYSYAYDDPTSTFQDKGASFRISFGPASPGGGTNPTPIPTTGGGTTPTPTASGNGFNRGANSVSSTQGQFWFQPMGWTAGYVIIHYVVPGQPQQNVNMTYNSSSSRWEYTAGGMSPGQVITYSFTYQKSGLQYDTGSYTWTHP
ncbi:MAG TPA: thaumatin family protein [Ktedonobacteraceae bacterium]|nr:thaumatin family protein [Ktedonobacteraceae bacterium]